MYFIENKEELIGKTIAYTNMSRFAECILIATTDGGILTVTQYSDDNGSEIIVHNKINTKYFIMNCKKVRPYLYEDLIKYNVFTEEEYNQLIDKHNKKLKEDKIRQEEYQKKAELEQYLKLKEKFEEKENN